MNQRFFFLNLTAVAILAATAMVASAQQTVTFVENTSDPALAGLGAGGYVDVFYTPSPGAEYFNHDLIVNATVGGILDPIRGSGGGQADSTTSTVDTWTHTINEIFVPNSSSYVFTTYNPVGSFPTFVGDPLPAPALNWTVFDTNSCDCDIIGPYHLARVLYSAGGQGTIDFLVIDQATVTAGGELFSTPYGVPEPTTLALAAMGLCGLLTRRRR